MVTASCPVPFPCLEAVDEDLELLVNGMDARGWMESPGRFVSWGLAAGPGHSPVMQ
jgi:hypothetical protein